MSPVGVCVSKVDSLLLIALAFLEYDVSLESAELPLGDPATLVLEVIQEYVINLNQI